VNDEDMIEALLRKELARMEAGGLLDRTSDIAQFLWCFLLELENDADRLAVLRVGKRIYLEARATQVFPAQA